MNIRKFYHIYLFVGGFIYYLILPPCVALCKFFTTYPGMNYLYENFDKEFIFLYIAIIILFLSSFLTGSLLPLKYINNKVSAIKTEHIIGERDLFLFSLPFFLLGQYSIIQNSNNLFKGYQTEYATDFMGSIATLNTLFLFFLIYYQTTARTNHTIKLYFLFSIIEFSTILLGLGSRMYILIPIISYIIYLIDTHKIKIKTILFRLSIAILLLLIVGIWRLGNTNFSIDALAYVGIAEPVFRWISAGSLFSTSELPLFAFPSNFITSFLNFIPTIFIPNKADLIQPISLSYYSPLGATSILVSLIANFGILGSCIALFLLGFFFSYIRLNAHTLFFKTYYCCICGIIPFQLFRDEFSIVNKMLFYNFLLFPCLFLIIEKFITSKYQTKS